LEAKTIAADVKQNLEKIVHHGKRADAIVKGCYSIPEKAWGKKKQRISIRWLMNICD